MLRDVFSNWRADTKDLLVLGVPVMLANAMRIAFFVTNNAFIGHLGEQALAAATLATSWMNCSIYFGVGLIFALDTYISQAYGAKNFRLIGIVFQNCMVICTLLAIPITVAWLFTEDLLLLLGQGEAVSKLAGDFTKWSIPGVLPYLYYRTIMRYLQNQHIMMPAVWVGLFGVFQNIAMNQIMINGIGSWQGLGFIGGPLASSITWIVHPILLWIYVVWKGVHKQTLSNGCEKEAISPRRLWDFLKIGVPSSMMLVLEVVGFEIITLLIGGMQNDVATSAHSVIYSLTSVVWVISSGFGNGAATRVGNLLGEQKADRARHFATFASYTLGAVQLLVSIILFFLRYLVPRVYTSVPAVVELAGALMPIGVVFSFFDGLATIGASILRGVGRQNVGTIVTFSGFYIVCIPVGVGLGFGFHQGVFGLWWGAAAGIIATTVGYYVFIYLLVDWKEEERAAFNRVSAEATGLASTDTATELLQDATEEDEADTI